MKKTFYLVMSEFHADGRVLAGMVPRLRREKPPGTSKRVYGMDAYEDWYESRAEAEAAVRELRGADRGIREREAAR